MSIVYFLFLADKCLCCRNHHNVLQSLTPLLAVAAECKKGANVEIITLAPQRLGLGSVCGMTSAGAVWALANIKISYRKHLTTKVIFLDPFTLFEVTHLFFNRLGRRYYSAAAVPWAVGVLIKRCNYCKVIWEVSQHLTCE